MLKIAVVTAYFPSPKRPTDGRSAYQTLRMLARDADVRIFCPIASYPSWINPSGGGHSSLNSSFTPPEDVNVNYCDYFALPLVSRPFNGWMAAHALLPHVRSFGPDLIFSCFIYPDGYAALKIGKELSVPVVVQSIGSDINRIGDPVSAFHTRTVLRQADSLVTVSEDLRRNAIAMGASPNRARSIINGCDLSVFHVRDRLDAREKLGIDSSAQAVVYIGRMDVRKGLRELVEAAAALRPERPDLHVYLVGEGPDRPIIEGAIAAHNAAHYIHSLPGCAFGDVAIWMAAADLVTLPSYMEGCPNSVLEALACGRPVVATNVGGIPEIMNDQCGRLVPPRDPAALANALAQILDETWNATAISAQRSRSWENVADELLEIFESLLSDRRAAAHDR